MVLRQKTVDNSVRYIPISKKTKESDIRPKTIKAGSLPKKNKNISQINLKLLKNVASVGLGYLKWKTNGYFWVKNIQIRWLSTQKLNLKKLLTLKWMSKCKLFTFHLQYI